MPKIRDRSQNLLTVSPWTTSRSNAAWGREPHDAPAAYDTTAALSGETDVTDTRKNLKWFGVLAPDEDLAHFSGVATITELQGAQRLVGHAFSASPAVRLAISATVVMDRVDCQQDEDWALLQVCLHSHATGQSVEFLAERVGGDVMRWQPPADPPLLPLGGFSADLARMPRCVFSASMLKADAEAEAHVQKFHPQESSQDALVTIGTLTVEGLPKYLLSG